MSTADTRNTLKLLRDHLGDLKAAQYTDPNPVWPPQRLTTEMWAIRDQEAAAERAERNEYALGDAPAPVLNLTAMETLQHVEAELLALADIVANTCQRPVPTLTVKSSPIDILRARNDHTDPRRWHYNASWKQGAHWAAVYVDGRLADEDVWEPDSLFLPMPDRTRREAGEVIRDCWQRTATILGIGDRRVTIPDRPCPWCGGVLILHQPADESPSITCQTGTDCTAPVTRDQRGRAVWDWLHLGALVNALDALERGEGNLLSE
ncbi:hypothetical protein ABIA32_002730 [Streptacidiphilus sp. MAP12-20]|uniref:hypothetical protein n=1 Tax=Streptacidiphilus sp. MAP12-20 TaxID=3156299 RepID=UPI0035186F96